jgi:uncharacterized protein YutE (UPF0331/DUF86 family)
MVDRQVLAEKIASVREAVAGIREVLPAERDAFLTDRTVREVVILNLFVALQDCMSLAAHWLSDAGLDVPQSYAQVFQRLGERGVLAPDLAARLAAASRAAQSGRAPLRGARLGPDPRARLHPARRSAGFLRGARAQGVRLRRTPQSATQLAGRHAPCWVSQ